jgi:hypothetical protein
VLSLLTAHSDPRPARPPGRPGRRPGPAAGRLSAHVTDASAKSAPVGLVGCCFFSAFMPLPPRLSPRLPLRQPQAPTLKTPGQRRALRRQRGRSSESRAGAPRAGAASGRRLSSLLCPFCPFSLPLLCRFCPCLPLSHPPAQTLGTLGALDSRPPARAGSRPAGRRLGSAAARRTSPADMSERGHCGRGPAWSLWKGPSPSGFVTADENKLMFNQNNYCRTGVPGSGVPARRALSRHVARATRCDPSTVTAVTAAGRTRPGATGRARARRPDVARTTDEGVTVGNEQTRGI